MNNILYNRRRRRPTSLPNTITRAAVLGAALLAVLLVGGCDDDFKDSPGCAWACWPADTDHGHICGCTTNGAASDGTCETVALDECEALEGQFDGWNWSGEGIYDVVNDCDLDVADWCFALD